MHASVATRSGIISAHGFASEATPIAFAPEARLAFADPGRIMKWYYEFEGKPAGPVSESDLCQLRAEGKVTPDTLVWCKGMDQWQKAEQVVYSFSPKSRPVEEDEDLAEPEPDSPFEQSEGAEAPQDLVQGGVAPSWENPDIPSRARAFLNTVVEVLFHPGDTFQRLHSGGSWGAPLVFFALTQCIAGVFCLLILPLSPVFSGGQPSLPPLEKIIVPFLLIQALTSPIGAAVGATVLHGSLWLAGCRSRSFPISFRVFCYGVGSSTLLLGLMALTAAIPPSFQDAAFSETALSISALVFSVWTTVVLFKAIQATQKVGIFRTLLVLLFLGLWAFLLLYSQMPGRESAH